MNSVILTPRIFVIKLPIIVSVNVFKILWTTGKNTEVRRGFSRMKTIMKSPPYTTCTCWNYLERIAWEEGEKNASLFFFFFLGFMMNKGLGRVFTNYFICCLLCIIENSALGWLARQRNRGITRDREAKAEVLWWRGEGEGQTFPALPETGGSCITSVKYWSTSVKLGVPKLMVLPQLLFHEGQDTDRGWGENLL